MPAPSRPPERPSPAGAAPARSDAANRIVQKLWSYCNVLRDDGLSYQDYLEQLTFLLFLKMADERARLTSEKQPIPEGYRWADLAAPQMEGVELEQHYRETLRVLVLEGGMLGLIFEKAQNKIQDPAKLRQLIVELIGKENWSAMSADVKGEAYEGLLERNAQDVKGGAGQYFTPRVLIDAMVDCVRPQPGEIVADPACGTGGFLLSAHEYLKNHNELDRDQKRHLRFEALRGVELVPNVARLCGMNLFLHGIGPDGTDDHDPPITIDDALRDEPSARANVVITASISSGSATRAWKTRPISPTRTSSRRRSPTISARRSRRSRTCSATWSSGRLPRISTSRRGDG